MLPLFRPRKALARTAFGVCAALIALAPLAQPAPPGAAAAAAAKAALPPAQISRDAQRAYESTRDKLVQIRTLLKNTNTQSSVGSGFFVSPDGLIITNFHVASQLALQPDRYRGVFVPVDGKEAEVELLAFDVKHDLALLRVKAQGGPARPALTFRSKEQPLSRGERMYSLGNPLDIGFAVTEGTFNGLVQRAFYPRIFFGGTLNPGMSGGPALDEAGRVVGVNVSKRLDGEMVSFLVPAEFAQALLERSRNAKPITTASHAEVTRQLLEHQELLTQRFTSLPLKEQRHGKYLVPVAEDSLARCWGQGRDPDFKAFDLERTDCRMDSDLFAGELTTGYIHLRHEAYDAPRLGAVRFASLFSRSFRNESFAAAGTRRVTQAECTERFVEHGGMPMRAVICMNAYRKLRGLYDVSVLVATQNRSTQGVQGRLDARGVSFENGQKLVAYYLNGFRWDGKP